MGEDARWLALLLPVLTGCTVTTTGWRSDFLAPEELLVRASYANHFESTYPTMSDGSVSVVYGYDERTEGELELRPAGVVLHTRHRLVGGDTAWAGVGSRINVGLTWVGLAVPVGASLRLHDMVGISLGGQVIGECGVDVARCGIGAGGMAVVDLTLFDHLYLSFEGGWMRLVVGDWSNQNDYGPHFSDEPWLADWAVTVGWTFDGAGG